MNQVGRNSACVGRCDCKKQARLEEATQKGELGAGAHNNVQTKPSSVQARLVFQLEQLPAQRAELNAPRLPKTVKVAGVFAILI